jgi:hypothetical protein
MQQSTHHSSFPASPFYLFYGIAMTVTGSFGCGLEAAGLAHVLHLNDPALANQFRLISFTAVMFGIIATYGVMALLRFVREVRSGL